MPRLVLLAAAIVVAIATLDGSPAAAGDHKPPNTAIATGAVTVELSMVAVTTLAFTTPAFTKEGPWLVLSGLGTPIIGSLAGYAAYRHQLDPRPALAIHGAGWVGLDLFMLGTLIDGRDLRTRLEIGPTAITLGALGVVAGGLLGALEVDTSDEADVFLAAAPAGFVIGGLGLGGMLVLIGGLDGDKAGSQFATGAVVGMSLGLGVAGYLAVTGERTIVTSGAKALVPSIQPGSDRLVVALAGTF